MLNRAFIDEVFLKALFWNVGTVSFRKFISLSGRQQEFYYRWSLREIFIESVIDTWEENDRAWLGFRRQWFYLWRKMNLWHVASCLLELLFFKAIQRRPIEDSRNIAKYRLLIRFRNDVSHEMPLHQLFSKKDRLERKESLRGDEFLSLF